MSDVDRISSTRRPEGRRAGYQTWSQLLFLHWEIPTETLRALVPDAFDIDTFDGRAYVGLVPFAMHHVRPAWCPRALGFNFLETNVRTYITHKGEPGVYFFSLEAASRIAVRVARARWKLPYFDATMAMLRDGDTITYTSNRHDNPDAALHVRYRIGPELEPSQPDTLQFWFLERYLLFTLKNNTVLRGQVHHTPYPPRFAEVLELSEGIIASSNLPPTTDTPPAFAHYSEGVDVDIYPLTPTTP